jgi:hypothetical protein
MAIAGAEIVDDICSRHRRYLEETVDVVEPGPNERDKRRRIPAGRAILLLA